jgi:hypothetical protein
VETSTELLTSEPAFHADDTLEVTGYRTLSALAIVGLLFGLASPLCYAWPLLMGIPLFGAALCIIAMKRIDASDGALAGRWAAVAGLMLCVASGAASISYDLVTRSIRTHQAAEFGREWIGMLLEGQGEEAFRLTVAGNRREAPPEPGVPPPEKTPLEEFLEHPIVTELKAAGASSHIRLGPTVAYEQQPARQFIVQKKILIEPEESTSSNHGHDIEALLTLQRSKLVGERLPRWLVAGHELPDAPHEADHAHTH